MHEKKEQVHTKKVARDERIAEGPDGTVEFPKICHNDEKLEAEERDDNEQRHVPYTKNIGKKASKETCREDLNF